MVGKKKRGHPDVEEVLARPWCYYCERDFDDLKILISHQKAKHFKCERCGRRLNTAGGLSVHMNQVHKETLTAVENALGNRAGLEVEIFGMEGIPEDVVQAHNQRIITQFYQAEAERRAATGNTGAGGGGGGQSKKPKFESPSELKKRLAEHKAKLAEQAATGGSSGGNTPGEGRNGQSPSVAQSPAAFNGSPYTAPQAPFGGAPPGANYGSYSQEPYAQPTPAYQQPHNGQPAYSPPGQYPQGQYPPQQFPPQQSFPPAGYQQPPFPGGQPPIQYSAPSPAAPYNQYQAPPSHSPPPGMLPNRPPSLPQAPGLPQRPSFSGSPAPPQQSMYGPPGAQFQNRAPPQNGWSGNGNGNGWSGPPQNPAMSSAYPHPQANAPPGDDIDEIIRMAEAGIRPPKKNENPPPTAASQPTTKTEAPAVAAPADSIPTTAPEPTEKKSKKDKDKNNKMVYSDNEVSPEEKMAKMPRYAFVPDQKEETTLVDATDAPGVAGVVDE